MDNNRITYLYQRFSDRTASPDEVREFEAAISDPGSEQTIKILIEGKWDSLTTEQMNDVAANRIDPIFREIITQPQEQIIKKRIWPRIAIAASVIIAMSAGIYFYILRHAQPDKSILVSMSRVNDIPPGGHKAVLTLANGQKIVLSDAKNGKLANESNTLINKTGDGQVIYTSRHPDEDQDPGHASLNTMETPRGGQYTIQLSDGTNVTLNAASSLRYPASFTGNERRVELTGEAYFEVAHNKAKPFKVITSGQEVEVLGTHFNINSYADEGSVKTTLLEGSVRVTKVLRQAQHDNGIMLKPNQQAVLIGDNISVQDVEANEFVSWKEGKFTFDKEEIGSIMRKVERWYNVQVVYQDNVRNVKLTGSVSRFEKVSKLLETLENTQEVHFKIDGKKIIVMR